MSIPSSTSRKTPDSPAIAPLVLHLHIGNPNRGIFVESAVTSILTNQPGSKLWTSESRTRISSCGMIIILPLYLLVISTMKPPKKYFWQSLNISLYLVESKLRLSLRALKAFFLVQKYLCVLAIREGRNTWKVLSKDLLKQNKWNYFLISVNIRGFSKLNSEHLEPKSNSDLNQGHNTIYAFYVNSTYFCNLYFWKHQNTICPFSINSIFSTWIKRKVEVSYSYHSYRVDFSHLFSIVIC